METNDHKRKPRAPRVRWTIVSIVLLAALLAACTGERNTTPGNDRADADSSGPTANAQGASGAATRPVVHEAFDLTLTDLEELVSDLPDQVQQRVFASPEEFLALTLLVLEEPPALTVLVDKETPLGPAYAPQEIVALDPLSDNLALSRGGHRLAAIAVEPLVRMSMAARDENITLLVSSAYRSFEYQREVYARWVDQLGQEEADRVSARPGTSQHQLGTAVDFGCICPDIAEQPAGRWLAANAWEYGFSMSYPPDGEEITGYSYEPWHFRYVGRPAAELEQRFFAGIQQWMLEFLHEHRPVLEEARPS
ncbi:MAG: M15 family metallopeptidase [Spirochaetales bacterium]